MNQLDDYALVVIDEAHNYRNPHTRRADALHLLMCNRPHVLMLSATPVNNSIWDFYNLLDYFVRHDGLFTDSGIPSIRERFEQAMEFDPLSLDPALLYPIIKASTVKRTRRFIKDHFPNDLIQDMDGQWKPICFPKPVAQSIRYNLDDVLKGFFAELKAALAPPNRQPELTLARYQPDNYLRGNAANGADTTLVGLIRTALLKRFESSAYAFAQTTKKMVLENKLFLDGLASGRIIKKD